MHAYLPLFLKTAFSEIHLLLGKHIPSFTYFKNEEKNDTFFPTLPSFLTARLFQKWHLEINFEHGIFCLR